MFLFLSWKTFICNGWLWHSDTYICWGCKYVSHPGLVLRYSRLGHLRRNFQAAKTFSHSSFTGDAPTLQSSHARPRSVRNRQRTVSNHRSDKWDFTGSERCSLCICSHARQLKTWKISLAALANLVRFFKFTDSLINPHSAGDTLPTTAAFLAPEQSEIAKYSIAQPLFSLPTKHYMSTVIIPAVDTQCLCRAVCLSVQSLEAALRSLGTLTLQRQGSLQKPREN